MPLFRPSELLTFLESIGSKPSKGLSQNFLIDQNILKKISQLADVQPGDLLLEIGPGPGALTEHLLSLGAYVIAIEKDQALADALLRLQTTPPRLFVIGGDALDLDLESILKTHLNTGQKAKIVANLPYQVATTVITKTLPLYSVISHSIVMVQKEVAERFLASPGNKIYGSLTVYTNCFAEVKQGFLVKPSSFFPPPKVHSAVIKFSLHPPKIDQEKWDSLFKLVRLSFSERRKQLQGVLKKNYPKELIQEIFKTLAIPPEARAESLSLNQYIQLFNQLQQRSK